MALELYKPDEATRSRGGCSRVVAGWPDAPLRRVSPCYEWLAFGSVHGSAT